MKDHLATLPLPSGAYLASGSRLLACVSVWCGVHCALTPLLVLAAPALALSEEIERVVWAGTVVLGGLMLILGPARRNAAVVLAFAAGSALWAGSLAGWLEPLPETLTTAVGSLILAAALLWSARVCQAGSCAVCAAEEGSEPGG